MAKQGIRFGVRSSSGCRAATWKIWTPGPPKSDVYLACRELKGELKASLHESGRWHVALSPGFYDQEFTHDAARPSSRFVDRWPRPPEIAPGVALAYRIIVPWFSATVQSKQEDTKVFWVSPPPEGHAIQFAVLITSPASHVSGWPGKNSMNSELVGSLTLANGETVWVVYSTCVLHVPESMQGMVHLF